MIYPETITRFAPDNGAVYYRAVYPRVGEIEVHAFSYGDIFLYSTDDDGAPSTEVDNLDELIYTFKAAREWVAHVQRIQEATGE